MTSIATGGQSGPSWTARHRPGAHLHGEGDTLGPLHSEAYGLHSAKMVTFLDAMIRLLP